MSRKHVQAYYDEVCATYHELMEDLKELEKEANEGMIDPDKFEQYKANIEPIKINFQRLSWIMYLLNQPNKKEKKKKYERQHQKELDYYKENNLINRDVTENKEILEKL